MSEFERTLQNIDIDWPDADISKAVTARIRTPQRRQNVVPRWAMTAAAVLVALALALATPTGREAVAGVLELAGIQVSWGQSSGVPGFQIELGQEVSPSELAELVDFPLLSPVDEPEAVYVDGGVVHMTWLGDGRLPAAGDTGVAILLSQFDGGSLSFLKNIEPEVVTRVVEVRGTEGLWIEGPPHEIGVVDGQPSDGPLRTRLAANVLAWEEDGVTIRIETTGSLADALELAVSLR